MDLYWVQMSWELSKVSSIFTIPVSWCNWFKRNTLQKVFAALYAWCFGTFVVKTVPLTRSYMSYVIRLHTESTIKPILSPNIFWTFPSHKLIARTPDAKPLTPPCLAPTPHHKVSVKHTPIFDRDVVEPNPGLCWAKQKTISWGSSGWSSWTSNS